MEQIRSVDEYFSVFVPYAHSLALNDSEILKCFNSSTVPDLDHVEAEIQTHRKLNAEEQEISASTIQFNQFQRQLQIQKFNINNTVSNSDQAAIPQLSISIPDSTSTSQFQQQQQNSSKNSKETEEEEVTELVEGRAATLVGDDTADRRNRGCVGVFEGRAAGNTEVGASAKGKVVHKELVVARAEVVTRPPPKPPHLQSQARVFDGIEDIADLNRHGGERSTASNGVEDSAVAKGKPVTLMATTTTTDLRCD
ncbi:hypothetical protein PIB30_040756 [Stylosanthes scabra]|uniref:Uncharacterized protein n=1 Tax=Stylosanthes scabra TaxID=79078 RepID=A0ABU6XGF8_9FABA|nr:hypothetical protein [Stylosanthes scabra]